MTVSVALLQITPEELDPNFNLEKCIEACRKAKALGADLALFPEMWNIGYAFCPPDKKREWEATAIDQRSDFFQAYAKVAKELGMNIAITYLEKFSPKPRNTVSIIDSNGKVALLIAVTPDLTGRFGAGALIKELAPIIGGRGGGKPEMAQAGGSKPEAADELFGKLRQLLQAG